MAKNIIVTEKPSVARTFAEVLGVHGNNNGYIEDDQWIITWCVGHLVTLAYPEEYDERLKEWKEEDLPFLPQQYKYVVIGEVREQFQVIKSLYNRPDIGIIYYAGDPAREGIYIQALVRNAAGHNPSALEKVVWIDSQTEEEIRKGIRDAKPYSEYQNLIFSGYERAIEDYATGINLSRMLSIKYGDLANRYAATKKYRPVAVGRVMSCVLGMIVNREREIENFKVTPFYKVENTINGIEAEWKAIEDSRMFGSPKLYNENGFKEEPEAISFMNSLPSSVMIEKIEKKVEKKYAPNLFNLAELQSECTKRFKISPDQTLTVAQSLYEKKLTTYPRTDARVLSTAIAKEIDRNLSGIASGYADELSSVARSILSSGVHLNIANTRYTDDSKVTDHYAIIPTGIGLDAVDTLTEIERKVYDLIVRRFLSIFLPPAEYLAIKLTENACGEKFFACAKALLTPGFLTVAGTPKNESSADVNAFDSLIEGNSYPADYSIKKGETTPPKRYTSGSMILAMENAGNLIEDEELRAQIKGSGIGTSATRAETIRKLVKQEYIELDSKTQVLTPAPMGNIIYEILTNTIPELLNPQMTASWEKGLEGIANGQIKAPAYRKILEDYIRKEISDIKKKDNENDLLQRLERFKSKNFFESVNMSIPCPICGSVLKTTPYGCICTKYKKDSSKEELLSHEACKFGIGQIAGKTIPLQDIELLLTEGTSREIKGFKSKSGKAFDSKLTLSYEDDNGIRKAKLEFAFDAPKESRVKCPSCWKPLIISKYGYGCSSYKSKQEPGCGFFISAEISGHKMTEDEVEELIANGIIKGKSFISKKKTKYSADLKLVRTDTGYKTEFVFDESAPEASSLVCPNCSGNLVRDKWNYTCSCGYKIGHFIAQKDISEDDIKNLIETGKTGLLRGFVSKKGKKFSAYLKLDKLGNIEFEFPDK